jgi:hypothetical protein
MYAMGKEANSCKGKIIKTIKIEDNELVIKFTDGVTLWLYDGGQSCCENRYMSCDDPLDYWEGLAFIGYYVADGPQIEHEYEVHEQQFLIVDTFLGSFTVANHNEHNGYYGGFDIAEKLNPTLPDEVTDGWELMKLQYGRDTK